VRGTSSCSEDADCRRRRDRISTNRAFSAIFGKVGRVASEKVIVGLTKKKCLPVLYYAVETFPHKKTDVWQNINRHNANREERLQTSTKMKKTQYFSDFFRPLTLFIFIPTRQLI